MTRIKQFANDMGLSYNQAKGLVEKGRKKKAGGSTVLEKFMPIEIVPKRKTDRSRAKEKMKEKMKPKKNKKKSTGAAPFIMPGQKKMLDKMMGKDAEVSAKNGKVTRINKDKTNKAKMGQFKNIANASASGGISPEEALKKIRKLVISKKDGGALKDLPSASENPGLRKLPTEVRNKMGYKKKGGTMKTTPKSRDMFKERTQFLFGKEITDVEKSNQEVLKRANKARADAEKKAKGMMGGGTYNMMPRKMSKGGVARGTGAAVKGTGFKGVY